MWGGGETYSYIPDLGRGGGGGMLKFDGLLSSLTLLSRPGDGGRRGIHFLWFGFVANK